MDFNKMLMAAKTPIMAIVGIYILASIISFIPVIGLIGGLLGLLAFFVLNPIILA